MAAPQPFEVQPPAVTVAFSCPFIQPAELLQLHFVLFFERFNLRVRADEVVRRGEVRIFDARDPPSELAQIGLGAVELAQHFFFVPVTKEKRHAGGDNASNKNHTCDTDVSWNSSFVSCLRHLAFPPTTWRG